MKKIVLTLAFFFATFSIMAQEHLSFKGIPIQGSLTEFCKKLEAKGFKDLNSEENQNTKILTGIFAGYEATVCVYATENKQNVHSVAVFFEPNEQWKILESLYSSFKELYTNKYGRPFGSTEESNARSESNTSQMLSLMQGTTNYSTIWDVAGGNIFLTIMKSPIGAAVVVAISYMDSQNSNINHQNALDDI